VVDIKKIKNHISFWDRHRFKEEKRKTSIECFDEYSNPKPLASLNQSLGLVYDNLAYDDDPHLHCL
jgi:hypothetical protein